MLRKNNFDLSQIMYRSDELMKAASNRYRITVQVAKRAKEHRVEDLDNGEELMKPVLRAILEMSDEMTQPQIIRD
jgi:DNA-directed RNA polymerase subunit omega